MSRTVAVYDKPAATIAGNGESELEEYLTALSDKLHPKSTIGIRDLVERKIAAGHATRLLLSDRPELREAFRHSSGFEVLFQTLHFLVELCKDEKPDQGLPQHGLHLLRVAFSVLTYVLEDHSGNQKYFQQCSEDGGWNSLFQTLDSLRQSSLNNDGGVSWASEEAILGCLFACAISDETVLDLFRVTKSEQSVEPSKSVQLNHSIAETKDTLSEDIDASPTYWEKSLGTAPYLQNPEALEAAFKLWWHWQDRAQVRDQTRNVSVIQPILHIVRSSTHNLVALHRTNLLNILLSSFVDSRSADSSYGESRELVALLLSLGITELDDAHLLYSNTCVSPIIAELLLPALKASQVPPYYHFDLSICGYSSIELPDLGTAFPPAGSSSGYTLSLWFQVWKFDSDAHTTLFGVFDSSQTCFVLVYVEKDSHNLILQTSVTSSKPSVRFKAASLREGRWYHVAIAHRRPSASHSSRASLFVNGNFVEQVKSNYPLAPPVSKAKTETADKSSSFTRSNQVQAFIGTPQDLASRLGKGVVSCQWRLASAYVFGEVLSDDLVAVYYELGPRYYGNYQDCLGSFNTYQAAASLKIRNDSLYLGRERRSEIIRAMETGASELLSEKKILLALSPMNVVAADGFLSPDEALVPGYLSKTATKTLKNLAHKGHRSIIVNGAVPAVNDAFRHAHGSAVLSGHPVISAFQSLDDALWRIGGCTAVVLDHFDKSANEDSSIRALKCIFQSVRGNWRCSEAMERENGFAILASLIARKIDSDIEHNNGDSATSANNGVDTGTKAEYALKVLTLILEFLGYRSDKPEHSVLDNPLAYRVLLVDADFWRNAPPAVQDLYYDQFAVFGVHSKYHVFNAKRLSKMRQ
ncbi:MAG: hypothetical protein Q9201_002145 [Fulgogasparrea decipioides]